MENNTEVYAKLAGQGFLFFNDIYFFLKTIKKIDLADPFYSNHGKKQFEEIEERVLFIGYHYAQKIIPQLEKMSLNEDELVAFNKLSFLGSVLHITPEIIPNQLEQIKTVINAIKEIKPNEVIVIIGEYNPEGK